LLAYKKIGTKDGIWILSRSNEPERSRLV
jgi:hypothetical protein